jgi:hypothetical protein
LDLGDTVTDVLSKAASLVPILGDALSSTIETIGAAGVKRELVSSARKFKTLAVDPVELSAIAGSCVLGIISNNFKRAAIIKTGQEACQAAEKSMFAKMKKFFKDQAEKLDDKIYGSVNKTAYAKLGCLDANKLIEHWSGSTSKQTFETRELKVEHFVEHFVKLVVESSEPDLLPPAKSKGCAPYKCNVFAVFYIEYDDPLMAVPLCGLLGDNLGDSS